MAARLGRRRHGAVRPDPRGLPPGGHAAHAGPSPLPSGRLTDWGTPVLLRYAPDLVSPAHCGLWRSLVARLVRDEEAAGSNPVSPTYLLAPGRSAAGSLLVQRARRVRNASRPR